MALRPALADSEKAAKPLVVVSLAGYDQLLEDLKLAGDLGGHPDLDKSADAILKLVTKGRGLAGIDTKRRSGAVILADGGKPTGYWFLPVTDLKQSLALLEELGHKSKDAGDGIIEIDTKQLNKRAFVREHNGWAFVADNPEALANTPEDPTKLIASLPQQYDGAVRLNVSNVPEQWRQKLIEHLKKQGQKHLERMKDATEEAAVAKMVAKKILEGLDAATKEIEQITLGWALDNSAKTAFLEVSVTALEGTNAAKQFAQLKNAKTDVAGFQLPGSAVTGNASWQFLGISEREVKTFVSAVRDVAFKHIDIRIKSKEEAEGAKKFVSGILRVAGKAAADGRVDQGGSLVLKPDAVTWLHSRYVADGRGLEKTLGLVVEAARKKHPNVVDSLLKTNVEECHGVRLHVVSIPIPDGTKDRDKIVQLVGENLEVAAGFGDKYACCAIGKDALKTLKQAINQSAANSQQSVLPLQLSISLGQVADFVATVAKEKDKPSVEKAAALLKESSGKDHVTVTATPIERGAKYRLELEEGVLKLLAQARKL